jgi:hypothetical protein
VARIGRRTSVCAWIAAILGCSCGLIQAQESPALASPSSDATQRPAFLRVDKDSSGKPRALQCAIAQYEIESGPFRGAQVDLIGAVHVGEKSYYSDLNRRFRDYDAVLYELVADPNERPGRREPRAGVNPIGSLQTGMKDMLKLSFQLEEVDYEAKNFVHADMSPTEFGEDMVKRNDGFISMFARLMGAGFAAQSSRKNSEAQADLMAAMFSRDPIRMRRAMAQQFETMDNQMVGLADKDGKSTLLTERNAKAFEVLEAQLKGGKRKVSVFYGAGHLIDMHDRLERDFQARLVQLDWIDAWDLRTGAVK